MNIHKLFWFGGLTLLSANAAIFISRLSLLIPEIKVAYILLVLGTIYFFKCQWDEGFRQALANILNLDEGEYIIILFCILIGLLLGGLGVWINIIL
ncbi:MAG: hypothetical protein QNJ68_07875 [Microcoleaceae cyanobacterium MO_207.B10]|nr:hypothetical protein [Microcoleaceae cyanobacterium MO_207.B10]